MRAAAVAPLPETRPRGSPRGRVSSSRGRDPAPIPPAFNDAARPFVHSPREQRTPTRRWEMRNGARWILVAAMMAIPAVPSGAQERPRGGGLGPAARALRLGDEIELTDAQRQQLRELRSDALAALEGWERERLEARQELRARRRQVVADPETTQAELRGLREEARARMGGLLSRRRELTAPIQERFEAIVGAEQRLRLREPDRRDRGAAARRGTMRDRWGRGEMRGRGGSPSPRGRVREGRNRSGVGDLPATPGGLIPEPTVGLGGSNPTPDALRASTPRPGPVSHAGSRRTR